MGTEGGGGSPIDLTWVMPAVVWGLFVLGVVVVAGMYYGALRRRRAARERDVATRVGAALKEQLKHDPFTSRTDSAA